MNDLLGKDFTSAKGDDNVFTPYSMTEQLLENENFDYMKRYLEPCCGEQAIVNALCNEIDGSRIYSFDIKQKNNPDFLKLNIDFIFDYIITNPPYSKLDKFIVKAKEIAIEKFAFLCKLTHLGGVQRFTTGIFKDDKYPLTKIYLFTRQANLRFTTQIQEDKGYIK